MKRTHHCNELRLENAGQEATLSGWVHSCRDLGGVIFIDVRDREGRTQVVFDPQETAAALVESAGKLHSESVISVSGKVRQRPDDTENAKIPTGQIEIVAATMEVHNAAAVLPFQIDDPEAAAKVMPINNFIVATEPLGDRVKDVLHRDVAVADSKFVVNYFRLSHDGRLLFGGGESYGYSFPSDLAAKARKPMGQVFPALRDVKIDYAWGGTLAITMKRLPFLARVAPNILSASGYSGHGVGTAIHAGQLMARAIQGDGDGFDTMSALPTPTFPGGGALRSPLLALAMSWFSLRDRLGI